MLAPVTMVMTMVSLLPVTCPVRQAGQGPALCTDAKTEAQVSSATHPGCQCQPRYRARGSRNAGAVRALGGLSAGPLLLQEGTCHSQAGRLWLSRFGNPGS